MTAIAVLPFKSALLGAAEARAGQTAAHVTVQPVSTAYIGLHGMPMGRENRPLFAWYGDMELVPHLWEALKAGPLDVVVQFHPPLRLDDVGAARNWRRRPKPSCAAARRARWPGLAGPDAGMARSGQNARAGAGRGVTV